MMQSQSVELQYSSQTSFKPVWATCRFCKLDLRLGIGTTRLERHLSKCRVRRLGQ